MMYKVIVKNEFHDKYTGEKNVVGEYLVVDEKRCEELLRNPHGLIEIVEEINEEKPKPKRKPKAKE